MSPTSVKFNGVTFYRKRGYFEWRGKKRGYFIEISERQPRKGEKFIMAVIFHGDIRWNSLWEENLHWTTIDEAMEYCSVWKPEGHKCLGQRNK